MSSPKVFGLFFLGGDNIKRLFILGAILGALYIALEGVFRFIVGTSGGWVHIAMLPVGGLCGVLIGLLNERCNLRIIWQSLFGTVIVLWIEFLSGCVLNLWLGLGIWDYTGKPGSELL